MKNRDSKSKDVGGGGGGGGDEVTVQSRLRKQ